MFLKYHTYTIKTPKTQIKVEINLKKKQTPQKTQILINGLKYLHKYFKIKNNVILHKKIKFFTENTLF